MGKYQYYHHLNHFLGACLLSFSWIMVMRYLGGVMIWLSIVSFISLIGLAVTYSVFKLHSLYQESNEESSKNIWQVCVQIICFYANYFLMFSWYLGQLDKVFSVRSSETKTNMDPPCCSFLYFSCDYFTYSYFHKTGIQ